MTVRRTIASACAAACLGLAGVRTVAAEDLSQLDLRSLMNMDITLVNAQKRTEDAAQVPISMTVVKADAIRALNLESTSDLQFVVPGLTTTSNVGLMLPYIRGIGTDINTSGIERSVAIYVDGVYQATQTFVDLADVEQIEVLKGPQGTLYGRNASGGAINITTRGPSDKFTATTEAMAGNLDLKDGYAFVSGPVNEDVRLSLAAHLRDRAGTYYNLYDGQHVDDEHYYSLHGRAQFDVTSTFRGEALVSYFSRDDSVAFGNQAELNSIPALLGYGVSTRPYVTDSDITDPANRSDATAAALKLTWEAPFAKLQSISSYANQRRAFSADLDASTAKLAHGRIHSNADVFTQELQLSPLHEQEHLDWLLGAFYIDSADAFTPVAAEVTVPAVGPLTIVTTGEAHTQATAMFGEATWWLNPSWSLTGGARYSYEYRVIDNSTVGILGGPVIQFPEHHHHWDDTTYRAIVKYSLERTMVYAKTETGFKSGVYNTTNTTQLEPVAPEKVTAYEIGVKQTASNLPLQWNAAAFYNDYRDLQIQVVDAIRGGRIIVQAPKAESYGVDLNGELKIGEHWGVTAGVSWLRAHYLEFVSSGVLVPSAFGGNMIARNLNMAGNELSRSPELTGNIEIHNSYPIHGGKVTSALNYYHSSRLYFDPANAYSQGAFDSANAQLGYESSAKWSVSGWVKNLTNQRYYSSIIPQQSGAFGQYAEPRTYGVTVGYAFGG